MVKGLDLTLPVFDISARSLLCSNESNSMMDVGRDISTWTAANRISSTSITAVISLPQTAPRSLLSSIFGTPGISTLNPRSSRRYTRHLLFALPTALANEIGESANAAKDGADNRRDGDGGTTCSHCFCVGGSSSTRYRRTTSDLVRFSEASTAVKWTSSPSWLGQEGAGFNRSLENNAAAAEKSPADGASPTRTIICLPVDGGLGPAIWPRKMKRPA
jgi:hypothetical protein